MFFITNDIFFWTSVYGVVGSRPHGLTSESTVENPTRHSHSVEAEPSMTIAAALDGDE